ncbi:alpha/beta hydrolase [Streptomyces sp. AV19]|uniref:alpha/beta fold hydrolase n=1 Tax=Streptomyces sp. AV19 TaxID=2793068 RepID=UPI0018FE4952|nr:alpha/beta hydrolase [Streptomyces sp. AV19]MBH1933394.1 alpha/beta hydrolase [Streptomyces sp. AV19]MDG4536146.1 alpha/beta hydrolase [Streptomyces sp. AV19]
MTAESFLTLRGRHFAYRDSGGSGPVVLALHGHFGRGRIFAPLAAALAPRYRVVALDQRGHGLSDNGGEFTPDAYVADAAAFLTALDLAPAAVAGHSMGGVVALLLARRHPGLVNSLVIVDSTVLNEEPETHPVLDVSDWPRHAPTREALGAAIEARGVPDAGYFLDSAVESDEGWSLLFDPAEMMASQHAFTGDHSADWTASRQPALLLRGGDSFLLTPGTARRMTEERANTRLREFPGCGHWLYADDPDGFAAEVGTFLDDVRTRR